METSMSMKEQEGNRSDVWGAIHELQADQKILTANVNKLTGDVSDFLKEVRGQTGNITKLLGVGLIGFATIVWQYTDRETAPLKSQDILLDRAITDEVRERQDLEKRMNAAESSMATMQATTEAVKQMYDFLRESQTRERMWFVREMDKDDLEMDSKLRRLESHYRDLIYDMDPANQ